MGTAQAAQDSGSAVPYDDKCEECYKVWKRCFPEWSWETFCKPGESLSQSITTARKHLFGSVPKNFPVDTIDLKKDLRIEVSRKYVIANAKELKSVLKVPKLTKKITS